MKTFRSRPSGESVISSTDEASRSRVRITSLSEGDARELIELGIKTSVRRKLVMSMVFCAVVAVLLTAGIALGLFRLNANRQVESDLRKQASVLGRELQNRVERETRQRRDARDRGEPGTQPLGGREQIFESDLPPMPLQVIRIAARLDAATIWTLNRKNEWELLLAEGGRGFDTVFVNGIDLDLEGSSGGIYRSHGRRPVIFAAQKVDTVRGPLLVVIGRQVNLGDAFLGGSRFLVGAAIAIAISVLIALWLSRKVDRPLQEMARVTGAIARGDYSQRVEVPKESELARLALSINAMVDQVSKARLRERSLLMNVSHDLRTPLTAIRGYAEALADGVLPDQVAQTQALEVIAAETARLERLVGDILDLARLDAGEFALRFGDVDLKDVVEEVGEIWTPKLRAEGKALRLNAEEQVVVETDEDRILQILGNLLENSARHTPRGGEITISLEPASQGARMTVVDTGSGIPRGDLPRIFDRLYVGQRGDRSKVGSGLGLAIVKQLVTALGGTVEIESALGKGTSVNVWVPLKPPRGISSDYG